MHLIWKRDTLPAYIPYYIYMPCLVSSGLCLLCSLPYTKEVGRRRRRRGRKSYSALLLSPATASAWLGGELPCLPIYAILLHAGMPTYLYILYSTPLNSGEGTGGGLLLPGTLCPRHANLWGRGLPNPWHSGEEGRALLPVLWEGDAGRGT